MKVVYTAAHGGFAAESVPLGGGAAVYEQLVREWDRTQPFELVRVTPAILGAAAPRGKDLVRFGEQRYARFCRDFERASTEAVLQHDPASTRVLINDISEGPDFGLLASKGYRLFTIYHVDVVAYIADLYLKGWVKPETTVRWYGRIGRWLPQLTRLIWAKQEASVRHSRAIIVPSAGMKEVIESCYPQEPRAEVRVLPWGSWSEPEVGDAGALRREFGVPNDALVLLALSRISPEKGQDRLLDALADWERRPDYPERPLWLFVCGEAAFMQGERYLATLRAKAQRLKKTKVVFPGYVSGARKAGFFALADLYVFPSRHESYGLTLLEALAAGVPAVCLEHHGSRTVMRPEFGAMVGEGELLPAIRRLLSDEALRKKMGAAARAYASEERFADRAGELAEWLRGERVLS